MKKFSIISTEDSQFKGTTRYGICYKHTDGIVEVPDISDRKELVDAIINLADIGNVTAFTLYDFVSGIIGVAV